VGKGQFVKGVAAQRRGDLPDLVPNPLSSQRAAMAPSPSIGS